MIVCFFGGSSPFSSNGTDVGFQLGDGPISGLFNLVVFIPTLSVGWRRLHDTNRTGWWFGGWFLALFGLGVVAGFNAAIGSTAASMAIIAAIFMLVWLAWLITLIVFFCLDSHNGDNKYGTSPKYGGQAQAFD